MKLTIDDLYDLDHTLAAGYLRRLIGAASRNAALVVGSLRRYIAAV